MTIGLRVNFDPFLLVLGPLALAEVEECGDFQTPGSPLVLEHLNAELVWVFRLDAICDSGGVPVVPSATAELN